MKQKMQSYKKSKKYYYEQQRKEQHKSQEHREQINPIYPGHRFWFQYPYIRFSYHHKL